MTTESVVEQEAALLESKPKAAWSPTLIVWICILFTVVPASFVYALNFERLGKPEKKKRAFLFALIGSLLYGWFMWRNFAADARTIRAWSLMISIVASWLFYLGQQSLFAQHIKRGGRKASLATPLAIVGIYVLLLVAVSTGVVLRQQAHDYAEFERARVLMAKGKLAEAEVIFKTFKRNNPEEANVYWNLAVIYSQTDRAALAKQELRELLRQEPDNQEVTQFLKDLETPL